MTGDVLAVAVDAAVDRIASVRWDDLEATVRDATSLAVLDSLGIAAGGMAAPGVAPTLDTLVETSGDGPVPVPWWGQALPVAEAAMALSLLVHAWDFDDTHDAAVVHACTVAVPAALATAYASDADGRRFLEGAVAGIQTVCRVSLALGPQPGVVRTAGLASLGAAAAASRVLGLGTDGLRAALSLAAPLAMSPTTRQVIEDSAVTKRHQPGFGVRHGVTAAFLARAGVEGAPGWFDGSYGLRRLVADDRVAAQALEAEGWEVARLSLKPYPACRYTHAAIAGVLRLSGGDPGAVADAARIDVHVPEGPAHELVARPWERRGEPVTDAQFSIPWLVAAAWTLGRVDLPVLTGQDLLDTGIEARARQVRVLQDRAANASGMAPVRVVVTDRRGGTQTADVEDVPGSPTDPLSWETVVAKAGGCLAAAGCDAGLARHLEKTVTTLSDTPLREAVDALLPTAGSPTQPFARACSPDARRAGRQGA